MQNFSNFRIKLGKLRQNTKNRTETFDFCPKICNVRNGPKTNVRKRPATTGRPVALSFTWSFHMVHWHQSPARLLVSVLLKNLTFWGLRPGIGVGIFGSPELRLESVSEPFSEWHMKVPCFTFQAL